MSDIQHIDNNGLGKWLIKLGIYLTFIQYNPKLKHYLY